MGEGQFWGPVTSTVNWCEDDYAVTKYVAEFFNTISSFMMFMYGVFGVLLMPKIERKFHLSFLTLMLVGLGSVAFHCTLQFEHQMWDEVPMLWTVQVLTYAILTPPGKTTAAFKLGLGTFLSVHCVVTSVLVSQNHPLQFYVFHASFGSLEIFCLAMIFKKYLECTRKEAKALYATGLQTYAFAILVWSLDLNFCNFLNVTLPNEYGIVNPQLHSWWHVFVTFGLYLCVIMVIEDQEHQAGNNPRIEYFYLLPFIKTNRGKKL